MWSTDGNLHLTLLQSSIEPIRVNWMMQSSPVIGFNLGLHIETLENPMHMEKGKSLIANPKETYLTLNTKQIK